MIAFIQNAYGQCGQYAVIRDNFSHNRSRLNAFTTKNVVLLSFLVGKVYVLIHCYNFPND